MKKVKIILLIKIFLMSFLVSGQSGTKTELEKFGDTGNYGVRIKNSNKVVIEPGKYQRIDEILQEHGLIEVSTERWSVPKCPGTESEQWYWNHKLIDINGNEAIDLTYHGSTFKEKEFDIRVYECFGGPPGNLIYSGKKKYWKIGEIITYDYNLNLLRRTPFDETEYR